MDTKPLAGHGAHLRRLSGVDEDERTDEEREEAEMAKADWLYGQTQDRQIKEAIKWNLQLAMPRN